MTSTTTDASSSDIAYYNAFVTTAANSVPELAALGTLWHAIASTDAINARDNTGTNPTDSVGVAVYNLADARVASTNDDLWDGLLLAPIDTFEFGEYTDGSFQAWTGTFPDGGETDPAFALGGAIPIVGYSPTIGAGWITSSSNGSSLQNSLYGMSDILTVPSVPEPGTMVLACLAAAGLAASSLRRRPHRSQRPDSLVARERLPIPR